MRRSTLLLPLALLLASPVHALSDGAKGLDCKVTATFDQTPLAKALAQVAEQCGVGLAIDGKVEGTLDATFQKVPVALVLQRFTADRPSEARLENGVLSYRQRPAAPLAITTPTPPTPPAAPTTPAAPGVFSGPTLPALPAAPSAPKAPTAPTAPVPPSGGGLGVEFVDGDGDGDVQVRIGPTPEHEGEDEEEGYGGRHDVVMQGDAEVKAGEAVRDVVALRGSARLQSGSHAREVVAVLGDVEVGPGVEVDREVVAILGDVTVGPGAHIGRGVASLGGRLDISPGATVKGDRVRIALPGRNALQAALGTAESAGRVISPLLFIGSLFAEFAIYFALGLVVLGLWPHRLERVALAMETTPARSFAIGVVGMVASPLGLLLLAITIVGLVLLPFGLLALGMASVLGFSALAVVLGKRLPQGDRARPPVLQLALGTLILVGVTRLPWIGAVCFVFAGLLALGAALGTRFGQPELPPAA